jgi:hypothetical protein
MTLGLRPFLPLTIPRELEILMEETGRGCAFHHGCVWVWGGVAGDCDCQT